MSVRVKKKKKEKNKRASAFLLLFFWPVCWRSSWGFHANMNALFFSFFLAQPLHPPVACSTFVSTPLTGSPGVVCRHDYESGIFDGGNKTNPDLDHLVQLIGYGEENGTAYWMVRNSWTPLWGDHGFIRLARTTDCGEDITPLDGNGCAGGPSTVKVCGTSGMLFDAGEHPNPNPTL